MIKMKLSFQDIKEAKEKLAPFVKKTKLIRSAHFSQKTGLNVFLKKETEQKIKSFKIRGALNKILSLSEEEKARGLIAASAGNHAQGVALAGRLLNIKTCVVMMENASRLKIEAVRALGAKLILKGKNYTQSYRHAQAIKGDRVFIHPFADPWIIAGQGTAGLEIIEDLPNADAVIAPVGGGGLFAGLSLALKSVAPQARVYGVVWEGTPDFCRAFNQAGPEKPCLCGQRPKKARASISGLTDGIAVQKSLPIMPKLCASLSAGAYCVSEKDIAQTLVELKEYEGITVEGSGASALAGLLKYRRVWNLGPTVCAVLSGGNIDKEVLNRLLDKPESL